MNDLLTIDLNLSVTVPPECLKFFNFNTNEIIDYTQYKVLDEIDKESWVVKSFNQLLFYSENLFIDSYDIYE